MNFLKFGVLLELRDIIPRVYGFGALNCIIPASSFARALYVIRHYYSSTHCLYYCSVYRLYRPVSYCLLKTVIAFILRQTRGWKGRKRKEEKNSHVQFPHMERNACKREKISGRMTFLFSSVRLIEL